MGNAAKIQAVINTLALLEMKTTYDNCNMMTGIYRTLTEVRDDIHAQEAETDGKTDAE